MIKYYIVKDTSILIRNFENSYQWLPLMYNGWMPYITGYEDIEEVSVDDPRLIGKYKNKIYLNLLKEGFYNDILCD